MQSIVTWLFVMAVYGTLVMPIVLAVLAWRSPPGRRMRLLLTVTGTWLVVCVVAGAARLATDDSYYSPQQITFWARSSTGERRIAFALLLATALTVIGGALLTVLVMLGDTVALGLH